jgi:chromate transport protein ChrA
VLVLLQHRLVQDSGILNLDQFLYAYALGRVTPGQNNLYLASVGYMIAGILGSLAAIIAIQIPGYLVLPVLKGYERVREQRQKQRGKKSSTQSPNRKAYLSHCSLCLETT